MILFICIWILACCLEPFLVDSKANALPTWVPQYGTARYPKLPAFSSTLEKGDYFRLGHVGGKLYRARAPGPFPSEEDVFFEESGSLWEYVPLGSFFNPYDELEDDILVGSVFKDEQGTYYDVVDCEDIYDVIASQWQPATDAREVRRISRSQCLRQKRLTSRWMTELRPIIGDERLGDLALPSTHDSATYGITPESELVDMNFLFQLGERLTPETLSNWSRTHDPDWDLQTQLEAGFRTYDLRVADMEDVNGTFEWWHGMAGDPIFEGLDQIADFAESHPEEVLLLIFRHFVRRGNAVSGTLPIRNVRKDELSDHILDALGDYMVLQTGMSDNPTINEILEQGGNIIAVMRDSYIRNKDDRYWGGIVHESYRAASDPEYLFVERSDKLKIFKDNHADEITELSGANTPSVMTIVAGMIRVYGKEDWLMDILEELLPGITNIEPDMMSFEGLYVDLVTMAAEGTNVEGMWARDPDNYSNGGSVHYRGVNDMLRHWLQRPSLYKVNSLYVDSAHTSDIVDTCIQGNMGEIQPAVTIAHQGNPRDGFYEWVNATALGGDEAHECDRVEARYRVTSHTYHLPTGAQWEDLPEKEEVTFSLGEYPPDSEVELQAHVQGGEWEDLFVGNIQEMILGVEDLYLRGTDLGDDEGFAYVSDQYDLFGPDCATPPEGVKVTWL